MNRRELLKGLGAGVMVAGLPRPGFPAASVMPKALLFDTFGTAVDWCGSIIEEGRVWGKAKGIDLDWAGFAGRWGAGYEPAMEKVGNGPLPWTKLDVVHRVVLEEISRGSRMTPGLV